MATDQILKRCGLSRTQVRLQILEVLSGSDKPVSGQEILQYHNINCNKSTVYRTLNSLYEKGLLARVIVDHEVKYSLKALHTEGERVDADHVHFKCAVCSQVYCLKELQVLDFELPEGFVKSENQFLIIGTCKSCGERINLKAK